MFCLADGQIPIYFRGILLKEEISSSSDKEYFFRSIHHATSAAGKKLFSKPINS
jgi:hypothetical protein